MDYIKLTSVNKAEAAKVLQQIDLRAFRDIYFVLLTIYVQAKFCPAVSRPTALARWPELQSVDR